MFRLTLRLALLPFFISSALLIFIRAQTYQGADAQTLLHSETCANPCFMGIQPGVTTPQQALSQLRSTDMISYVGVSEPLETVAWFWNDKHPTLMDNAQIPALFYDRNEVSSIRLYTRISLGDVLLQLDGLGQYRIAVQQSAPYNTYNATVYYLGNGYLLSAVVNCHSFWNQPTYVVLGSRPSFIENNARMTSLNDAKHRVAVNCRRRKEG